MGIATAGGITIVGGVGIVNKVVGQITRTARIWRSDGGAWEMFGPATFGQATAIYAVAATRSGFVAGGYADGNAAVWLSSDGREWSKKLLPTDSKSQGSQVTAIAVSGESVVAVGYAAVPGLVPMAWRFDGSGWSSVALPGGAAGGQAFGVIATPGGFIAVGNTQPDLVSTAPTLWRSADGGTWTAAPSPPNAPDSDAFAAGLGLTMRSIATAGGKYVAIGWASGQAGPVNGLFTWTSGDGAAWRIKSIKDVGATSLTVVAGEFFATGVGGYWTSRDGMAWTPSPFTRILMTSATADSNGFIAAGWDGNTMFVVRGKL